MLSNIGSGSDPSYQMMAVMHW